MPEIMQELHADVLHDMLNKARARTLTLSQDWTPEQLLGPRLTIVNPPLWEIGHIGWFQEYWCLRYRKDETPGPPKIPRADELYNSAIIPHDARWDVPLPDIARTKAYLDEVLSDTQERLGREGATPHLSYFIQLAAFHEVMHCEAFTYTRQTLGYGAPHESYDSGGMELDGICSGDAEISGGHFLLGATEGCGFVFDNEKWAHEVLVSPFRMSRTAVSNAEFAAFVEDDGYRRREFWSAPGWKWRLEVNAEAPVYWQKQNGTWFVRHYDRIEPLPFDAAVVHVNWYEADAYCKWAGRRLPTEAEWEFAASTAPGETGRKRRYPWGDAPPTPMRANLHGGNGGTCDVRAYPDGGSAWGVRQMIGNVWEWTVDWFNPYPGFVADSYKEYSQPWFGNHKVLRGGCFATSRELLRNTWRNFYTPDRRDVLAGFRTCAL